MKPNQVNYIKANIKNGAIIELENILDFYKYVELHNVKEVFIFDNASKFGVLSHQFILQINSNGYETIEDAKVALLNKFPSATDFYNAKKEGICNYEIYEMKTKFGITDKQKLEKIEREGYFVGFEQYKISYNDIQKANANFKPFENALQLYNYVVENNFEDYNQGLKSLIGGFTTVAEYKSALEKGFEYNKDYKEALINGFPNFENYQKAKDEKVKTYIEFIDKHNLELSSPDLPHDQSLLLLLLSKLEQGKKVGVTKLKFLLEETLNQYKDENGKLYDWFQTSLKKNKDYISFLEINSDAAQFGHYDKDGEYLEIFQLQNRSIVIDGSNVAHNSQNGQSEKPSIANLIKMVRFLKTKGFSDILIIADASLRHKLIDLDKLPQLNDEAKYLIAPAGVEADVYLIDHVKRKHCLLLSNDAFKQYKMSDPWVALNIDYYRLTFMITEEGVFMPDIK
ncbi:MAG: hypothetical protein H7239_14035 [Flavobacterium sp.]|nr:hypothetical protein [Flavobacterium sp.]